MLVAATLAIMAMRWFNTAALQGVALHFRGATVATLMFGGRVACGVMAAASLAGVLLGTDMEGWAWDFLLRTASSLPGRAWRNLHRIPEFRNSARSWAIRVRCGCCS